VVGDGSVFEDWFLKVVWVGVGMVVGCGVVWVGVVVGGGEGGGGGGWEVADGTTSTTKPGSPGRAARSTPRALVVRD